MKSIRFILIIIIFLLNNNKLLSDEKVLIKFKINNEIITNYDLEREKNYLNVLNPNLKKIEEKLQIKIATDSIVKEIVKKQELKKYFDIDNEDIMVEKYIENFFLNLGFKNVTEFENYLVRFGWTLEEVKKKIKIEVLWNQVIFDRFKNQIKIDVGKLENKIKSNKKNKFKTLYNLSEIIFQVEKDNTYIKTLNSIQKSISEIGFENTANLYSISDSAKIGGKIGLVDENSLSSNLSMALQSIKIGEYAKPVKINNGFIILKINSMENKEKIIDIDKELKKLIKSEETKQLNNFSKIYLDKVKINTKINEY